jgi:hypothetical protein
MMDVRGSRWIGWAGALLVGVLVTLGVGGCSDAGEEDDTGGTDGHETYVPPAEGLRVFPKYMLAPVQAIVTLEPGGQPVQCPPDADVGGYLCDINGIPGATVLLRVDRDGFETALREPAIVQNPAESIEVHLSPEGGPTGTWSECSAVDTHASCADVCAAEGRVCSATSCATGDGSWPVATLESFAAAGCSGAPLEAAAAACGDALPVGGSGAESLRCCCVD